VTSPRPAVVREAIAIILAALAVVVVAVFASRSTTAVAPTAAVDSTAPSVVIAVDAIDPRAAVSAWRAAPAAHLPGRVLVLPTSVNPSCVQRTAESGAATERAVEEVATCVAADPAARDAARELTLNLAAQEAQRAGTGLVLVGDGWTKSLPLSVADPANPQQVGVAILAARVDQRLPNLTGLKVTVVAAPPSAVDKAVWDAYFLATEVDKAEWINREA
jgi:hypothetical protein